MESGAIFQMVVTKGSLIGLMRWALSIPLAIPLIHLLDNLLGSALMTISLSCLLSTPGILAWIVIALVISAIESLFSVRNAVRLINRKVLAYE